MIDSDVCYDSLQVSPSCELVGRGIGERERGRERGGMKGKKKGGGSSVSRFAL